MADRVCGDRRRRSDVSVRRGAEFERDLSFADVGGERAENVAGSDVISDAEPVADPVGAARVDGFPDGGQTVCLSGVDGERKPVATQQVEGFEVLGRWIPGLGAGDVEPDHPPVPVP